MLYYITAWLWAGLCELSLRMSTPGLWILEIRVRRAVRHKQRPLSLSKPCMIKGGVGKVDPLPALVGTTALMISKHLAGRLSRCTVLIA